MKNDYIVISSNRVEPIINEALEYTFGNLVILKNDNKEVDLFAFKNLENYKRIIIVGLSNSSIRIIARAKKDTKINFIFDREISETTVDEMQIIKNIINSPRLSKVGFLFESAYCTFKDSKKTSLINLNIGGNKIANKQKSIGIISKINDYCSSFYNALSAASLLDYDIYVNNKTQIYSRFLNNYKINVYNAKENFINNLLNISVNFYNDLGLVFLKSMNSGALCLIGNNSLLGTTDLMQELQIQSDDSVYEIANKIETAINNKTRIFKEYHKFKNVYDKYSKDSIMKFLD